MAHQHSKAIHYSVIHVGSRWKIEQKTN